MTVSSLPINLPSNLNTSTTFRKPAGSLSAVDSGELKQSGANRLDGNKSEAEQQRDQVQEQRELQKLKSRDREVRAHELAHVAVGSRYVTKGASFSYERGPDGRLYAVGGEVSIDTSPVPGDPQATLLKSQIIARAALAPTNPSAQDRRVAAQAAAMAQQARAELALQSQQSESETGQNIDAFA